MVQIEGANEAYHQVLGIAIGATKEFVSNPNITFIASQIYIPSLVVCSTWIRARSGIRRRSFEGYRVRGRTAEYVLPILSLDMIR
jgi:hypothetical protein